MLQWSGSQKDFEIARAAGLKLDLGPDPDNAVFLLEAFSDLSTCRATGPIPLTAIFSFADRYGLGDTFIQSIRELDDFYLKEVNDRETRKDKGSTGAASSKAGHPARGRRLHRAG